jgi:hypothetical protein
MSDLATLIFVGISAAFAVVAALAARRSAAAAEETAKQAQGVERRSVLRDVHASASEVAAEGGRIDSLLTDLRKQYQTLFAFAGQSSGPSKMQGYLQEWEERKQAIQPALDEAAKYSGADPMLPTSSSDELTLAAARLRKGVVEVTAFRTELERKVDELSAQNSATRQAKFAAPMPDRSSGVNPKKPY